MKPLRVIIGCEFSGIVRDAFRALGHEAWSCDLLPCEGDPAFHIQGDLLNVLGQGWDLGIFHPHCRYLNKAGMRWLYKGGRRWIKDKDGNVTGENPRDTERWQKMHEAVAFFKACLNAPIASVCVENSEMHPYALKLIGAPCTQSVQPWMFGHGEVKESCYWLRNLPLLQPTDIVSGRTPRVHHASPGPNRWKERSRTLEGVAMAMALQWSDFLSQPQS